MPSDVTNIVVESAQTPLASRLRPAVTGDACFLTNKVTVKDPVLTFQALKTQLDEAVAQNTMDEHLHYFAAVFGATKLENATFVFSQVQNVREGRAASSQLTGAQIAGVVIGVLFAIALFVVAVCFACKTAK